MEQEDVFLEEELFHKMKEMVWITRDAKSNIDGVFACKQEFTTEQVSRDDPKVIDFYNSFLRKPVRVTHKDIQKKGPTDVA